VLTGNVGPNAFNVFQAANVPIYLLTGGTVREAVEAYKAGRLQSTADASVQAHAGMGMGRGMGLGQGAWGATPPPAPAAMESRPTRLKQTASELRKQLAEVMERLEKLEPGLPVPSTDEGSPDEGPRPEPCPEQGRRAVEGKEG
jgi:predicted Fe-Mo cluster-binding NifX family protein